MDRYRGMNQIMPKFLPGATTPDPSEPGSIYPGPKPYNQCFRFTNKTNNACERIVIDNWWEEIIALFGQEVTYWQNPYQTLSADGLPPGEINSVSIACWSNAREMWERVEVSDLSVVPNVV